MVDGRKKISLPGGCSAANVAQVLAGLLFVGISCYIALFLELPAGVPQREFYAIALLTGAYGLWRLWNGITACRGRTPRRRQRVP